MILGWILGGVIGQFFVGYALNRYLGWSLFHVNRTLTQEEQHVRQEKYLHRVAVALDICANVLLKGREDETISARVRRLSDTYKGLSANPLIWIAKVLNGWLNFVEFNHGHGAEIGDLVRAESEEQTEDSNLGVKE